MDYMHARHFSPITGRFLSVDQLLGSPRVPQSWNRYAYARANPLRFLDPDGLRVREYTWKSYLFRLDRAHGGPHVDVVANKGKGALLGRVSRATGEVLDHLGKKGQVPNVAMKYMRSRGWIPAIAGVAAAGAQMFFGASPADATPLPPSFSQEIEALDALNALVTEVAMDLFGGPLDPSGLTAQELELVFEELERRADEQQEREEEQRRKADASLSALTSGSCAFLGLCQ